MVGGIIVTAITIKKGFKFLSLFCSAMMSTTFLFQPFHYLYLDSIIPNAGAGNNGESEELCK